MTTALDAFTADAAEELGAHVRRQLVRLAPQYFVGAEDDPDHEVAIGLAVQRAFRVVHWRPAFVVRTTVPPVPSVRT